MIHNNYVLLGFFQAEGETAVLVAGDPEREHMRKVRDDGAIHYHVNLLQSMVSGFTFQIFEELDIISRIRKRLSCAVQWYPGITYSFHSEVPGITTDILQLNATRPHLNFPSYPTGGEGGEVGGWSAAEAV